MTDSASGTATQSLAITINTNALSITTASLPDGTVGTVYSQTLIATGGSGTYTWSIPTGTLPVDLSVNAAGTISGTPSATGTASFTVQVSDGLGTETKDLSIIIYNAIVITETVDVEGNSATLFGIRAMPTNDSTSFTTSFDYWLDGNTTHQTVAASPSISNRCE